MSAFEYGPVEFYLVTLPDDGPPAAVLEALADDVASGTVRVLDFVIVRTAADGSYTTAEYDGELELHSPGMAGDEDIEELAELLDPETVAAVVVLELTWARVLSGHLAAAGGEVLSVERIPAPVVNALVDAVDEGD